MSDTAEPTPFLWVFLAWLLGLVPLTIAWVVGVGLGLARDAPMFPVCLVTALALILPAVGHEPSAHRGEDYLFEAGFPETW